MLNKQLLSFLFICIPLVVVAVITATITTTAAPIAADETVTCDTVINSLRSCLGYVIGGGIVPSECCNGLKSLLIVARTTADHQSACKCLKSIDSGVTREEFSRVASIPRICKAKVPFKISPDVDCSKIK
uniref:Non-specific lipid-transfer protein n=1 Tax=Nicotiana tabacum TaxID=4097 RepID=V5V1W1_TOBAC|nr:non-specific lipid-transfer protein 1-like [Nicotiana tomentosiformis]XP_016450818.1 PREDICTED: non-specific lipid-transfer protein 1-like [Nicotiana tabacum]AHB86570.1 non-specific lipid-transfer protein LTP1.1 [Nicotiana tabacum]